MRGIRKKWVNIFSSHFFKRNIFLCHGVLGCSYSIAPIPFRGVFTHTPFFQLHLPSSCCWCASLYYSHYRSNVARLEKRNSQVKKKTKWKWIHAPAAAPFSRQLQKNQIKRKKGCHPFHKSFYIAFFIHVIPVGRSLWSWPTRKCSGAKGRN